MWIILTLYVKQSLTHTVALSPTLPPLCLSFFLSPSLPDSLPLYPFVPSLSIYLISSTLNCSFPLYLWLFIVIYFSLNSSLSVRSPYFSLSVFLLPFPSIVFELSLSVCLGISLHCICLSPWIVCVYVPPLSPQFRNFSTRLFRFKCRFPELPELWCNGE